MKRFVYYWTDGRDWGMDYWNAPNFRTAKTQIFKAYKTELKEIKGFQILFIAEIKYEEEQMFEW